MKKNGGKEGWITCFSGSGGIANEGNFRLKYDCKARKFEKRRSTVTLISSVDAGGDDEEFWVGSREVEEERVDVLVVKVEVM